MTVAKAFTCRCRRNAGIRVNAVGPVLTDTDGFVNSSSIAAFSPRDIA